MSLTIPSEFWQTGECGFPSLDWEPLAEWIESRVPESEWNSVWSDVAKVWVERIQERLGSGYTLHESANFLLLAQAPQKKAAEVLSFLESCLSRIRASLPLLTSAPLYGKCPVLVFAELDRFYEYLADYTQEDGEYAAVGGVYLNRGYGHFALPNMDLTRYTDVLSHELCHALLAQRQLPAWLDEAITATVEHDITGRNPYVLDREMLERHRSYWNKDRMQRFWRGESFWSPDEGQELSYHLARFLLNALRQGGHTSSQEMNNFVLAARREDAGLCAAEEVLGIRLDELLTGLVGDGEWKPQGDPETSTADSQERGSDR